MSYIPPSLLHLLSLSNCQVWGVLKDEPSLKIIIYLLLPHTGWKKHRITHWWSNQILLSPYGIDASLAPLAFPFGNRVPLEGEPPIKTSDHWLVSLHVVFKVVPVNGVNHWAHNGTGVFSNPKTHQKKKKEGSLQFLICNGWNREAANLHLSRRGSIHPSTHSQWQSRKVSTSPVA